MKPLQDDINKMHAYRDALDIRAAVILYPGNLNIFYDSNFGHRKDITLENILLGNVAGIGALSYNPTPVAKI
jgi:predicted component of viral defense system (DUF524 family)